MSQSLLMRTNLFRVRGKISVWRTAARYPFKPCRLPAQSGRTANPHHNAAAHVCTHAVDYLSIHLLAEQKLAAEIADGIVFAHNDLLSGKRDP